MLYTVFGKGGAGKTMVALHLARIFASKGKTVLLMSVETRFGALQRNLGIVVPDEKSLVNAILDGANESYYQHYSDNIYTLSLADTDNVNKSDIIEKVLQNKEVLPRFTKDIVRNFDVVLVDCTDRLTDELTYNFVLYSDKVIHLVDARPEGLAFYNAHSSLSVLQEREVLVLNKLDESIANKKTIEGVLGKQVDFVIPFNAGFLRSSYKVEVNKKLMKGLYGLYSILVGEEKKKKKLFGFGRASKV